MNKNLFIGIIISIVCVMLYKTGANFMTSHQTNDEDTALSLYDINFIKEQNAKTLPSYPLTRHGKKEKTFTLADLKGKPVILHFWGTDCGPCRKELPAFNAFAKAHPEIEVIALTLLPTSEMPKEAIQQGLIRFGAANVPVITDEKGRMASYFDIMAIPSSVFINKLGNVVGTVMGIVDWKDPRVEELLLKAFA